MANRYYSKAGRKLVSDAGSRQGDDGKGAEREAEFAARQAIHDSVARDLGPVTAENFQAWSNELNRRLFAHWSTK